MSITLGYAKVGNLKEPVVCTSPYLHGNLSSSVNTPELLIPACTFHSSTHLSLSRYVIFVLFLIALSTFAFLRVFSICCLFVALLHLSHRMLPKLVTI